MNCAVLELMRPCLRCLVVRPVTDRATARFPSADVLVDYMADFAKPQEQGGHISYGTDVRSAVSGRHLKMSFAL